MINKLRPETWILKFVREIGSGVAPTVEKGERIEGVVVELADKALTDPLDALGSIGTTNTPRTFGMPFVTRKLKVPGATLENE